MEMIKCAYHHLIPIDQLEEHPHNANIHPQEQIELLAKIMAHQGWRNPITVSENSGFIVTGHCRLLAAQHNVDQGIEGFDLAPVDRQHFNSPEDEFAHMTADNKVAELAEFSMAKLNQDFLEYGPDLDVDFLGIPGFTIEPADLYEDPKDKEVSFLATEKKCPSCGYEW